MSESSRKVAVQAMLSAESVAVVGATDDPGKPGFRLLDYLTRFGYRGRVYPVNPRLETCQGMACYPDLESLPEVPQLVGVVVAARRVPGILREAATLGVGSAVVISAGFAEAGTEGGRLQDEVAEIARSHPILICGPNSVGITRSANSMALTFTEALTRGPLAAGHVGMVSQSGAFGTVLYAQARDRGIGINTYISSGNEACVSLGDYVEALVDEPDIHVVGAYVEGLRDAEALTRAAVRSRELGKPLVMLKVGRSEQAGQAAASHTGSLVGNDDAYRAAFDRHGIVRVGDEKELLDVIEAFQLTKNRAPKDNRVAIVSTSGGAGVLLTDLLEVHGLRLAHISDSLHNRLRTLLPEFAGFGNPIDVTGRFVTDPTGLEDVVNAVAADPEVDLVIAFVGLAWSSPEQWAAAFKGMADLNCPIMVVAPLLDDALADSLRTLNVPVCRSLRQAASVSAALVRWGGWTPPVVEPTTPTLNANEVNALPAGVLDEDRFKTVLASVGLAMPRARVTTSPQEAAELAAELGCPVALKADVIGLAHKSDLGGVLLGYTAEEVPEGYAKLRSAVATASPEIRLNGVRVEEMIDDGIEMVIGAVRAHPFGALVMVGAGGTEIELKRDLAYGIAPITTAEAYDMISALEMLPLLKGYRGREEADVDALATVLVQVSQLAADMGDRLVEMDLNPIVVRPQGKGVMVLDAMAVLD